MRLAGREVRSASVRKVANSWLVKSEPLSAQYVPTWMPSASISASTVRSWRMTSAAVTDTRGLVHSMPVQESTTPRACR